MLRHQGQLIPSPGRREKSGGVNSRVLRIPIGAGPGLVDAQLVGRAAVVEGGAGVVALVGDGAVEEVAQLVARGLAVGRHLGGRVEQLERGVPP